MYFNSYKLIIFIVFNRNLEEQLAISESKRLELKRRLKAYENNEELSDKEEEPVVLNSPEIRNKAELARKANDDADSEDVPQAKKLKSTTRQDLLSSPIIINDDLFDSQFPITTSKNQYLLGSPIVISEDSSDEGAAAVSGKNFFFISIKQFFIHLHTPVISKCYAR